MVTTSSAIAPHRTVQAAAATVWVRWRRRDARSDRAPVDEHVDPPLRGGRHTSGSGPRIDPRYANATNLPKPWFAGEVGCGPGNVACTYGSGIDVQTIDKWWLDNLKLYGAKAVLIEDKGTLFIRRDPMYELKPVAGLVQDENERPSPTLRIRGSS